MLNHFWWELWDQGKRTRGVAMALRCVALSAPRNPVVRFGAGEASRTSYSQTRGRTTSAFDAANEDQEFDLDSLTVAWQNMAVFPPCFPWAVCIVPYT